MTCTVSSPRSPHDTVIIRNLVVIKYTDVDYYVYTDAARLMTQHRSPYDRSTYRYTPFLAVLMVPAVLVWEPLGKIVFAWADVLAGLLTAGTLVEWGCELEPEAENGSHCDDKPSNDQRLTLKHALIASATLVFSPLAINLSTRGSADSLTCALASGMLYALMRYTKRRDRGMLLVAAVVFGVLVHFRLFPIIFALPLTLFILRTSSSFESRGGKADGAGGAAAEKRQSKTLKKRESNDPITPFARLRSVNLKDALIFALVSGSTCVLLTAAAFWMYGRDYLDEALLYHIRRVDVRHNFSLSFYPSYLRMYLEASETGLRPELMSVISLVDRLLKLVPWGLQVLLGLAFYSNLPFCLMLQTIVFVIFNRVITAQYFLWWSSFIPFLLFMTLRAYSQADKLRAHPGKDSRLKSNTGMPWIGILLRYLTGVVTWLSLEVAWLVSAMYVEIYGQPVRWAMTSLI